MDYVKITRDEASAKGYKRFYTGVPCSKGHDAQRYTRNYVCVECNAARSGLFANVQDKARGQFFYPLHPDDLAAARAYCQALDMARGRTPYVEATRAVQTGFTLPPDLARFRDPTAPPQEPYLPREMMSQEEVNEAHNRAVRARWGKKP